MCQLLVSCVGFLFDLLAFMACGAAFALPHWVFFPSGFMREATAIIGKLVDKSNVFMRNQYEYEGLLARAYPDGIWNYFWQNDFDMEKDLPAESKNSDKESLQEIHALIDWHKAAQALYTFGIVILLSTVLLAFLHVACRCCCQKAFSLATVIGALIFASFVLIGAAVGVFTAFQHMENNVQIDSSGKGQFYYSVYVAAGGLLAALLSAILFLCDGCQRQRPYDGYETARMI